MKKLGFAWRTLAGVSAIALTTPAWAQPQTQPPEPVAEEAAQDDQAIIVTAQRREQNLQDVPLAISVIGEERIQQLQVADARDLSGLAPNVTVTQGTTSNSAAVISIRGINTPATETFGLDSANALYVDGILIARSGAAALDISDIERVEILRGPQGTLFGRNTTGGAIAFISRQPSEDFGLRAELGYGNFDAIHGRISFDTGEFIEGVSATLSYGHRRRDGTVDNLLQPRDSRDPGARQTDAFRAAIRIEPTDDTFIRYIFDWSKVAGNTPAFQLTNTANGTARPPLTIDGQQIVQTQQAPVAQYLAAATFLEPGCAELATPTRAYRDTICLNSDDRAIDETWGHNLQIGHDFGPLAVKFTGGHRRWDSITRGSDLDGIGTISGPLFSNATLFNGMPAALLAFIPTIPAAAIPFISGSPVPTTTADLFETSNDRRHEQLSAELEFSGETDTLDWVFGAFYFEEEGSEDNPQTSGFVLDTNGIFLGNFGALGPAFVAANPARYRLVVTPARLAYSIASESTAVFAQATFYPGGRDSGISLTAGGRYTWDDKSIIRTQNGAAPLVTPETGEADFSRFTWNIMGRYEFAPDVSVYGRVATGYRSGGFNASDPTLPGTSTVPRFDEETVTSYELGLRSLLFDRRLRLNVAVYHNVFDDLALIQPVLTTGTTFQSRIVNAGQVEYTGIEVDFDARLTDNFSIDGAIGYVDINFIEFLAGQPVVATDPVVNIASIARPTYTSPFTANLALNASFPVGGNGMELRLRVAYTHEDGRYSFNNSASSPFNEQIRSDGVNMIDAQIVLDHIPLGSGEGRVMLWGKNLTDDNNLMRGIDFGQLGYAGGYFNDPATYGVTLGVRF